MSFAAARRGDFDLEKCPRCQTKFATDVVTSGSIRRPVPISCGICGGYTLCYVCVTTTTATAHSGDDDDDETAVVKCPACNKPGGFDPPVPNVALCRALDHIQSFQPLAEGDEAPPRFRAAKRFKKESDETTSAPKMIKVDDSDEASSSNQGNPDQDGLSSSRRLDMHECVYCLWPENDLYYPGYVDGININKSGDHNTTYTIQFDDGDRRKYVERSEIYNREESIQEFGEAPPAAATAAVSSQPSTSQVTTPPKSNKRARKEYRHAKNNKVKREDDDDDSPEEVVVVTPVTVRSTTSRMTPQKDAFMKASLFHLNPFLEEEGRVNQGFVPFIREQVATLGYPPVDHAVLNLPRTSEQERLQLKHAILKYWDRHFAFLEESERGASHVSIWLTHVQVGSYILIRHNSKGCLPRMLKDAMGKRVGPVYVLGEVTAVVPPYSAESVAIRDRVPEIAGRMVPTSGHLFCRVCFNKMGRMDSLSEATKKYMNSIVQPTLNQICKHGKKWPKSETDAERVRDDLWSNAIYDITPESLNDESFFPLDNFQSTCPHS